MRPPRLGNGPLTPAIGLVAALVLGLTSLGAVSPVARADTDVPPTAGEVQAAQDQVATTRTAVERVQAALRRATAEVDAAAVRAAKAAEAWNGARFRAAGVRAEQRRAVAAAARARVALEVQRDEFRDVVLTIRAAGFELSVAEALVGADGMETLLERSAAGERVHLMLDQQRTAYEDAAAAAEEAQRAAAAARRTAEQALADARVDRDEARASARAATATASAIDTRRERLVRRLADLEGVSLTLARQRQAALEQPVASAAAATAREGSAPHAPATAAPDPQPGPQPDPEPAPQPDPEPPAPAGGAEAAIAFARAQIGEPYRWGAAGPDAWDCSGLTSRAWAAGGRSLPHYSVAQYEASTSIDASQLRPGDLVFWGEGRDPAAIYHVALYVGDGRIVHAPRTGRPVTEESLWYWRAPDFYARP